MALCEEEVGEVDFGRCLGGSGVVLEEGADAEVEVVSAVDLVGEFYCGVVVVLVGIGTGKEGDGVALEGFEEVYC